MHRSKDEVRFKSKYRNICIETKIKRCKRKYTQYVFHKYQLLGVLQIKTSKFRIFYKKVHAMKYFTEVPGVLWSICKQRNFYRKFKIFLNNVDKANHRYTHVLVTILSNVLCCFGALRVSFFLFFFFPVQVSFYCRSCYYLDFELNFTVTLFEVILNYAANYFTLYLSLTTFSALILVFDNFRGFKGGLLTVLSSFWKSPCQNFKSIKWHFIILEFSVTLFVICKIKVCKMWRMTV